MQAKTLEELVTNYQDSPSNDTCEEILKRTAGLVEKIVKLTKGPLPLEDIRQEGRLGVIKAIKRFNPGAGYKFKTYAGFWVRKMILRGIENTGETIRKPNYVYEFRVTRDKTIGKLQAQGIEATPSEISEAMGLSLKEYESLMNKVALTTKLASELSTEDGLNVFEDVLCPSDGFAALERAFHNQESLDKIVQALSLYLEGKSEAFIAMKLKMTQSSVNTAILIYNADPVYIARLCNDDTLLPTEDLSARSNDIDSKLDWLSNFEEKVEDDTVWARVQQAMTLLGMGYSVPRVAMKMNSTEAEINRLLDQYGCSRKWLANHWGITVPSDDGQVDHGCN